MNSLRSRRAWNRNVGYQLFPDYTDMGSIWDHLERLKVQQWYTKTGLLPIQLFFSTLLEEPQLQQKQTQKGKKYKDFGMLACMDMWSPVYSTCTQKHFGKDQK